ncbi:MAG: Fic family protein [Pseudomonadota bacterium]
MTDRWIWLQPDWPHFTWQQAELSPLLRQTTQAQGQLLGIAQAAGAIADAATNLDTLLQNIITSSAIEGEELNAASVRSSLAKRLRILQAVPKATSARSEGLAELMLDATNNLQAELTPERLFQWHRWLFPEGGQEQWGDLRVGDWRGDEPMQVVSGRIDKPTVHFEAPPRAGLEQLMAQFCHWFNTSRHNAALDPLLRAGIAHFWFVTVHPFEDGNGRIARAIADLALAQADQQSIRLYAMSAAILERRNDYYRVLEQSQKATLDITVWLKWFLETLQRALQQAQQHIDRVLTKTRYWQQHQDKALQPMQVKVLNRLLDGGDGNFEHGISAAQYQAVAKVSKATATRHLAELLEKGCLEKLPGGGRSTRYHIPGTVNHHG